MKTAIYRRPTSADQAHAVDIRLGDGDTRTVSIHDAQHIYEKLGMGISSNLWWLMAEFGEGDKRTIIRAVAIELFNDLERVIGEYIDYKESEK